MLQTKQSPVSQIRLVGVQNTSGNTIPAFGAMNVTGVDPATGLIQVNGPPTADNQECLFAWDLPIQPNSNGNGCRDFPLYALYYQADGTPVAGQQWGASAGLYTLRNANNNTGYLIYGGPISGRVKVAPALDTYASSSGGGGGPPPPVTEIFARVHASPASLLNSSSLQQIKYATVDANQTGFVLDAQGGLTIPSSGYYEFGGALVFGFNSNPAAGFDVELWLQVLNNLTNPDPTVVSCLVITNNMQLGSGGGWKLNATGMGYFASGAKLTGQVDNVSGVSLSMTSSYLWMRKLIGTS